MARYAVINPSSKVVNIVLWDGVSNWKPPVGCKVVICDGLHVHVGDSYDDQAKSFVPNPNRFGAPDNQQ